MKSNFDVAKDHIFSQDASLQEDFLYNRKLEVPIGGGAKIIIFDDEAVESERTIIAKSIADCIGVVMWGKTKENKNFVSVIHKSGDKEIRKIAEDFLEQLVDSSISYLVIPGIESSISRVKQASEECHDLWGDNERSKFKPDVKIIKNSNENGRTSIAIRGALDGAPQVLVIRPNILS